MCYRSKRQAYCGCGLEDIVVVDTDDATLVCDKEHAGEIKKILAKLREEGKNEYL